MGIVDAKKKAAAKSKGGKTGIKEVKKHMKGGSKVTVSAKAASVKKKTYPTKAEVLPRGKMPKDTLDGTNPPAVNYLQGVIYTCQTQKKFRGLRVRGNPYTEKSASWINQTKAALQGTQKAIIIIMIIIHIILFIQVAFHFSRLE